jgi:hypothetical protein
MQGVPYPVYAIPNKGKGGIMYPGENYVFPKADYVDEYPMMQKGGQREPIFVSNLKDPRLKAYKDSLAAYENDRLFDQELKRVAKNARSISDIDKGRQELVKKYPLNSVQPIKHYGPEDAPIIYSRKDLKQDIINDLIFKKPVQPIVYRNDSEIPKGYSRLTPDTAKKIGWTGSLKDMWYNPTGSQTKGQSVVYINTLKPQPEVEFPSLKQRFPSMTVEDVDLGYSLPQPKVPTALKTKELLTVSEKPTSYSYSYPSSTGQRNIYFPNRVAWKAFIDQYDGLNTQETTDGANASPGVYSQQRRPNPIFSNINFSQGGQHGGLDRWFAEKWVDVKTGKTCGRQEGENRSYPACRPSRRVSSETPKTSSEMSPSEKAKFKRTKTSSQRIPYNHKRK